MNDMSTNFVAENPGSAGASRILAVDDDRVLLMMLEEKLETKGYEVLTASDGQKACDILQQENGRIDVILLDREMPNMNGLEVVEWLKRDPALKRIPVVMQTGADTPDQVKEGIDAGVFYYLTKPLEDSLLYSVMTSAVRESDQQKTLRDEMNKHRDSFTLVDRCDCTFRSLEEAESLSCFVANFFPDPERVLSGLAELLINAVEHGNLAITYDEKSALITEGTWRDEILKRLEMPIYSDKRVALSFQREEDTVSVIIEDQGEGFDWQNFMTIDPARATDNHGRGIAQANMLSFDTLEFNDVGNRVTASVGLVEELDW